MKPSCAASRLEPSQNKVVFLETLKHHLFSSSLATSLLSSPTDAGSKTLANRLTHNTFG